MTNSAAGAGPPGRGWCRFPGRIGTRPCDIGQQTTQSHAVQVAVDVELQKIRRRIAWTACLLRLDISEASCRKVQPADKRIYETHRVVWTNIFVKRFRQQQCLGSVGTG